MPARPLALVQQLLPRARARLLMSRLSRRYCDRALCFLDAAGGYILVSRDCGNRSRWRVTWFDLAHTPNGHACAPTQREALLLSLSYGAVATSFSLEPPTAASSLSCAA